MKTDRRREDLAAIHAKRKQLGWDEDTYRTAVREVGGAASGSSRDLDFGGRRALLDHMKTLGATSPPKRAGKRPHNYDRLPAMVEKVEALLADMGLSWAYADTIARRISGGNGGPDKDPGVEKLAWLKSPKHWRGVVAALHVEQDKRELLASVDRRLQELGLDRSYADARGLRKGWERNRAALREFSLHLTEQFEQKEPRGDAGQ